MTKDNAATANDETCLVCKTDLRDVQHEVVILLGLIEGIAHLDNDGHGNARTATIDVAFSMMNDFSLKVERLGGASR